MHDDNNNELGPGDAFAFEGQIDEVTDIEVDEPQTLTEGEYMIYVPPGQKATVVYSLAA
jgi:hypothetical protein